MCNFFLKKSDPGLFQFRDNWIQLFLFFCCVALKLCTPLVTNINELFSFILFIALMPPFFTCLFAFFIVWIDKRL